MVIWHECKECARIGRKTAKGAPIKSRNPNGCKNHAAENKIKSNVEIKKVAKNEKEKKAKEINNKFIEDTVKRHNVTEADYVDDAPESKLMRELDIYKANILERVERDKARAKEKKESSSESELELDLSLGDEEDEVVVVSDDDVIIELESDEDIECASDEEVITIIDENA